MRICKSFSEHCSMRWKWSKHLYKFSFSLHVLQVVNWLYIKSVQLYELGIDQSFSFVKIYELGVNQSIFLTFLLVEDWLDVLCTVLWVGEREGGLEEEVPGDVWQPRPDERETGRVTELPVRPTHSGGEPQKRPGNILYVMWMTYDWSALIYEVF